MYKEEFTIDKKCFVFFNFYLLSCIFGKMKLFKFDFVINCHQPWFNYWDVWTYKIKQSFVYIIKTFNI